MKNTAIAVLLSLVSIAALAEEIALPPSAGAGMRPSISAAREGGLLLSWIDSSHTLWFSTRTKEVWSSPRKVVSDVNFLVGPNDTQRIIEGSDGSLYAFWLVKGAHGFDGVVSNSGDGGATWSSPEELDPDGVGERGFVSIAAASDGGAAIAWIKEGPRSSPDASLRYARLTRSAIAGQAVLDPRVCDCCNTAIALTRRGMIVAYRDRSASELRDISVVRQEKESWTAPRTIHSDGWKLNACPMNPPRLSAIGDAVASTWYSGAADQPRVEVAFSSDGGRTFAVPIRVDSGHPIGHADVALVSAGAWVVWVEANGSAATVLTRFVPMRGTAGPAMTLGPTGKSFAAGNPFAVHIGGDLFVAWSEPGVSPGLHLARVTATPK